ncbi:MAG: hypothetical protein EBQ57_08760 [Actinobacteria bacterium]|nr:hypothetical protein [Actinomycetota bacterium]
MRRLTLALLCGAIALGAIGACSAQRATAPGAQDDTTLVVASAESSTSADLSALTLSPIAELEQPVDAAYRTGDDAVYFVSRTGTIHRYVNGDAGGDTGGDAFGNPVLDISDLTEGDGERGLLGLAFSPDGSVAYVNYTSRSGDTVVASLNVAANGTFDRGSLRTIITIEQPFRNHNAGDSSSNPTARCWCRWVTVVRPMIRCVCHLTSLRSWARFCG